MKTLVRYFAFVLFVLLENVSAQTSTNAARYQVVDLGTLPGYSQSVAMSINNKGEIVGTVRNSVLDQQAVLWTNGVTTVLPSLTGYPFSYPVKINDTGKLAGNVFKIQNGGAIFRPVVWEQGNIVELPRPVLHPAFSHAMAIAYNMNQSGEVVGFVPRTLRTDGPAGEVGWFAPVLPALWFGGGVQVLSTHINPPFSQPSYGIGMAINNQGQIAGAAIEDQSGGRSSLVTWLAGSRGVLAREVIPWVGEMNDRGEIAGGYWTGSEYVPFIWREGGLVNLGTLVEFGVKLKGSIMLGKWLEQLGIFRIKRMLFYGRPMGYKN